MSYDEIKRRDKLNPGDEFQVGVPLEDGRIFWGTIAIAKIICDDGAPMYRPKWGKVDKIPAYWRRVEP